MRHFPVLVAVCSLAVLVGAAGCSTTKFAGQVVSCADHKPLPDAKLSYKSTNSLNNNMAGTMPASTDKDGKFEADVAIAQGAGINVTVERDGFEKKEQTMSGGPEQQICLDAKK